MAKISIIGGTGALGSGLARRLAAYGHDVVVGSRDGDRARIFAAGIEHGTGKAVSGAEMTAAAGQSEICFVTVPYAAQADTLRAIAPYVSGKILVDATVPLKPPRVGTVQLPAGGSAVVEGAEILGTGVRVVSALQNISASKLESSESIEAEVLICSDDQDAAATVKDLLAGIGLRGWYCGPLANSAASEALTSVLIQMNRRYKLQHGGIRITGQPLGAEEE